MRKSKRKSHPAPRKAQVARASASPPKRGASSPGHRKIIVRYKPYKRPSQKTYDLGKGKTPQRIKSLVKKARQYKKTGRTTSRSLSYKITKDMVRNMQKAGYTPDEITAAKKYKLSPKVRLEAYSRVRIKIQDTRKKKVKGKLVKQYKIGGKWISKGRFKSKVFMTKYNAILKAYRRRYGLTLKEAQELYRGLRDEKFGQKVFQALY